MDVEQVLKKTQKLWSEWQEMGLSYICPDLAPVLRQHTELPDRVRKENTYTLTEFFDGQSPIWDIALEMRQSLTTLSRSLHHFLKQGIIELRELPDLPSPEGRNQEQAVEGETQRVKNGEGSPGGHHTTRIKNGWPCCGPATFA